MTHSAVANSTIACTSRALNAPTNRPTASTFFCDIARAVSRETHLRPLLPPGGLAAGAVALRASRRPFAAFSEPPLPAPAAASAESASGLAGIGASDVRALHKHMFVRTEW